MRADFVIVADAAQVAEGKLYVMGGAWNRVMVAAFPATVTLSVALGVMVSWDETNQPHTAHLSLDDEDGRPLMGPIDIRIEVGRPTGTAPGEDQRVVIVVNGQVTLPAAGGYAITVRIADEELGRTGFRAVAR